MGYPIVCSALIYFQNRSSRVVKSQELEFRGLFHWIHDIDQMVGLLQKAPASPKKPRRSTDIAYQFKDQEDTAHQAPPAPRATSEETPLDSDSQPPWRSCYIHSFLLVAPENTHYPSALLGCSTLGLIFSGEEICQHDWRCECCNSSTETRSIDP